MRLIDSSTYIIERVTILTLLIAAPVYAGMQEGDAVAPAAAAGASYCFADHWAFRLQIAYVRYSNSANFNQSGLDLDFSGVMISPMLVWRM